MRMDEWIAAFGSEEILSGDDDEGEGEPLENVLSWCDGNILWIPATEDVNDDDDAPLHYSSSESSSAETGNECNPQSCDLQCVCVDCLKCPNHCSCNYSSSDYKRRGVTGRNGSTKHSPDEEIRPSNSSQSFRSKDSFWSAHFPFSSQSSSTKKTSSKNLGFMVVPNNICVGSFFDTFDDTANLDARDEEHSSKQDLELTLRSTFGTFDDDFHSHSNSPLSQLQSRETFP